MPRTLSDHVATLRQKPHHVREVIAMGTSVGITGIVALVWMLALSTSGSLRLNTASTSIADQGQSAQETFAEGKSNFSNLLGAAGVFGASSTPASLTIVDAGSASTLDAKPQTANNTSETVLRF